MSKVCWIMKLKSCECLIIIIVVSLLSYLIQTYLSADRRWAWYHWYVIIEFTLDVLLTVGLLFGTFSFNSVWQGILRFVAGAVTIFIYNKYFSSYQFLRQLCRRKERNKLSIELFRILRSVKARFQPASPKDDYKIVDTIMNPVIPDQSI
jgi:hypothetical protein